MASLRVVVVGASGQQGSNVIDVLKAKKNVEIYGIVRDTSSAKSRELISQGVKMISCDVSDQKAFEDVLEQAKPNRIFLVTFPWGQKKTEKDMGYALVDAVASYCKKNKFNTTDKPYVVFSSVGSADIFQDIPHFGMKFETELYLKQKSENSTLYSYYILRPVFFMDNFKNFVRPAYGSFQGFLKPDTKMLMISAYDIGRTAVACFENPQKFNNGILELGADSQSMKETAAIFSKVWKTTVQYQRAPWYIFLMGRIFFGEMVHMFHRLEEAGYKDEALAAQQKLDFTLLSLKEWTEHEFNTNEVFFKKKKQPVLLYVLASATVVSAGLGCYYYFYKKK